MVTEAKWLWSRIQALVPLKGHRVEELMLRFHYRAVGSLVVRAPDSRPEGLGLMPLPPNTLQVHTEYMLIKSVGPKVLWAESQVQGTGENFPPFQFHA
ncbi:uncharacterized protein TNCV_1696541 [Trichonephila clavipes]|nr:uncharacterized protein TNCV_1696541 [Trichonephila clavipes]